MVANLSLSSKRQIQWINVVRPASKPCPPPLVTASSQVAQIGKKSCNRQGKPATSQRLVHFPGMDDAQPGRWKNAISALHVLHIYGATALASFGFVVAIWLRFDPAPWAGLWFAGSLFAYNIDRLARDPADAINVPRRAKDAAHLGKYSAALAAAALLALILVPLLRRDWLLLSLVVAGALVCAAYSVALFGRRLKDLPMLKTFLVPTAITASLLVPPLLKEGLHVSTNAFVFASAAVWCFLFFNVLLCDLRDIEGDMQTGTCSLPVLLGVTGTRRLLVVVIAGTSALCACSGWNLLATSGALYMGSLLVALRARRSEQFYEWWVEGMLFLPAAICLLHQAGLDSF